MSTESDKIDKENKDREKRKGKRLCKVLIRRLPPYLTWEELKEQLDPLPDVDYVSFVPADLSFAPHAFSRCYLVFTDQDAMIEFSNRFNRYVFVDSKGHSSAAIVERAIFQRIPKKRRENVTQDAKCGVVEEEVDYKKFLDELEEEENFTIPTLEQQLQEVQLKESAGKGESVKITPLTMFIMNKIDEKVKKAEERRYQRNQKKIEKIAAKRAAAVQSDSTSAATSPTPAPIRKERLEKPLPKRIRDKLEREAESVAGGATSRTERELSPTVPSTSSAAEKKDPPAIRERPNRDLVFTRSNRVSAIAPKDTNEKKRNARARPEREIYRPGARHRQSLAQAEAQADGSKN